MYELRAETFNAVFCKKHTKTGNVLTDVHVYWDLRAVDLFAVERGLKCEGIYGLRYGTGLNLGEARQRPTPAHIICDHNPCQNLWANLRSVTFIHICSLWTLGHLGEIFHSIILYRKFLVVATLLLFFFLRNSSNIKLVPKCPTAHYLFFF